ncbi:MAG TPA: hypothetical protein VGM91_00035 [Conexibacter sp.]
MPYGVRGSSAVRRIDGADRRLDSVRRSGERLVFPDSNHRPAGIAQSGVDASIALGVAKQLGAPIIGVDFWHLAVRRAAVPLAAVEERRDPTSCERKIDVRADALLVLPIEVSAEPQSAVVNG